MNSVERRNLKKMLDEKDGLTKAAIRELPSNSKEENQKKLKKIAAEILKKNDDDHDNPSKLKISNKSIKVKKIKTTKKPKLQHYLSNSKNVSKQSLKILNFFFSEWNE